MSRRQINLYDPRLRRQRDWLDLPAIAAACGVALLITLLSGWWVRTDLVELRQTVTEKEREVERLRQEEAALQAKVAGTKPDPVLARRLEELHLLDERQKRILAHLGKEIEDRSNTPPEIFAALSRRTHDKVWLTAVAFEPASGHVSIRGRTLAPASLPAYIAELEKEPVFQGRRFAALELVAGRLPSESGSMPSSAQEGETRREAPWSDFALLPEVALPEQKSARGG